MSNKPKVNKNSIFFHDRANELRQIQQSLESLFPESYIVLDPLMEAAKKLDIIADGEKTIDKWGYDISNLILPVGDIHNVKPTGIQAKISVSCSCEFNVKDWDKNTCDPFLSYSFRIRIFGDCDGVSYSWGMHIDKNDSSSQEEWHPLYHLHCFESRLDSPTILIDHEKKRGTFLLNVPRIVHYPLDIVLGIGFCLMNFHKKDVFQKIYTNDLQFPRLYNRSRDMILGPFFGSLAGNANSVYDKKILCPQIV